MNRRRFLKQGALWLPAVACGKALAQSLKIGPLVVDPLYPGLFTYWQLETGAATTRVDATGNGNSLVDVGGANAGAVAGLIGNGNNSAGSAVLRASQSTAFRMNVGDSFTISGWVKFTVAPGASFQGVITFYDGAVTCYFLWFPNTTTLQFACRNAANNATATLALAVAPTTNVFHHCVVGYDNVNQQIFAQYDNGARQTAASVGIFKPVSGDQFDLLAYSGGGMTGVIDEVGMWKRVLTVAEATRLFNGGAGLAYPY